MKVSKDIIRNLADTADIVNTISGGVVESSIQLIKRPDHYLVEFRAPGIDPESLVVQVNQGNLVISKLITMNHHIGENRLPYLIQVMPIPYDVEVESITGKLMDKGLKVKLPISEYSNGYQRDIDLTY